MAIDPFTGALVIGGLNAGMNVLGAFGSHAAKRQQYVTDKAFQSANNRFSMWQAGFTAKVQDANKQHQFWQDTVNYNQNLAFAHSQRNVELLRSVRQAEVVKDTRVAAGVSYVQDAQALQDQLGEVEMNAAVAQQQYTWRALQARASVQAMAMEGNSVDRIVQDYSRQLGDQMTLEAINEDIRDRQYTRAQAGQVQQYLGRWNSQQFYDEAQVFDPIAPFPPLPSLITPPPPSRVGAPPSNAAYAMNVASGLVGGLNSGLSMYSTLKGIGGTGGGGGGTDIKTRNINFFGD